MEIFATKNITKTDKQKKNWTPLLGRERKTDINITKINKYK